MPGNSPHGKDACLLPLCPCVQLKKDWTVKRVQDMNVLIHLFKIMANGGYRYISMPENLVRMYLDKSLYFHNIQWISRH